MPNETAAQMIKRKRAYELREELIADACESAAMQDEMKHPEIWNQLTKKDGLNRIDMIYDRCSVAIADDICRNETAWSDISYSSMKDRAAAICSNIMSSIS